MCRDCTAGGCIVAPSGIELYSFLASKVSLYTAIRCPDPFIKADYNEGYLRFVQIFVRVRHRTIFNKFARTS